MKILGFVSLCVCGLFLSACVDIKIASEIPKLEYFSLQNIESDSVCKFKTNKIGLLDVIASTPFDNSAIYIFDKQSLQINELSGKRWISPPKEMFKTILISKLQKHCFDVASAPFGTQKLDKILKTTLLSLQIINDNGNYKAEISVFYEIFDVKNYRSKSGTIIQTQTLDSLHSANIARAFAHVSNETFNILAKKI